MIGHGHTATSYARKAFHLHLCMQNIATQASTSGSHDCRLHNRSSTTYPPDPLRRILLPLHPTSPILSGNGQTRTRTRTRRPSARGYDLHNRSPVQHSAQLVGTWEVM